MNIDDIENLDIIFKTRSTIPSERVLSDQEISIVKEIEEKAKKNKINFLINNRTAIDNQDLSKLEEIERKKSGGLVEIIPENWKEEYKKVRQKGLEESKKSRNLPGKIIVGGLRRNGHVV